VNNALETLRCIDDEVEALEYLIRSSPDVSMAVNNVVRLSSQGHEMHFYGVNTRSKGNRLTEVEAAWRDFAARINTVSNAGLDGLIEQFHRSAYVRGAQACEVEIASTLDDVVDVHPVIPQSIEWEWDEKRGRWVPYQQQAMKKVSLEGANFFWVPLDPLIDDPRGTLLLAPAINAEDFQMQIRADMQKVLHNQGWPRYDVALELEKLMSSMPAKVKGDPKAQREWLTARVNEVQEAFRNLRPDDSFVHTDDVKMNGMQGGNVTQSIDVRAIAEWTDVQTMGGLKQLSVFLNRTSGVTETWSTVQFRIFVTMIQSIQRGSKRLVEEIARLWLRTQGIQAVPVFTHNTIDWQAELEKVEVKQAWQKFYAVAVAMGWISNDDAASEVMGTDGAVGEPPVDLKVSLAKGGVTLGRGDDSRGRVDEDARQVGGSADGAQARLRVFGGRGDVRP
jgi:hypothetical protein